MNPPKFSVTNKSNYTLKYLTLFIYLLVVSCSNHESDQGNESAANFPQVNDQFQSLLDEFPKIELPVQIKGCEEDFSKLKELNSEKSSNFIQGNPYAYGQLKTNGNYIALVMLEPTDCFLPQLRTYKLTGELIDSKTIALGYCGSEPCYECSEYMSISSDFKIYASDTITTTECDEDFIPIAGTESTKVIYKTGMLTAEGIIQLSEEVEKSIQ